MRKNFFARIFLLAILVLNLPVLGQLTYTESQRRQVVLTWQNDPSTSMTIIWRTDIRGDKNTLRFAEKPDAKPRKCKLQMELNPFW